MPVRLRKPASERSNKRNTTTREKGTTFATPKEAATHFGVSVDAIRKWLREDAIPNVQPAGKNGRRFIPRSALTGELTHKTS